MAWTPSLHEQCIVHKPFSLSHTNADSLLDPFIFCSALCLPLLRRFD